MTASTSIGRPIMDFAMYSSYLRNCHNLRWSFGGFVSLGRIFTAAALLHAT